MLDGAEPPMTEECCIYRVPYDIRRLNEDAYTPKVVSIGPFHRNNGRLKNMERHKLKYFKGFVDRSEAKEDALVSLMEEIEASVRRCYSEAVDLSREDFIKVILVDACFIIEHFWRFHYSEWVGDDPIVLKPWLATNVRLDLLLLENQLPFFVLEKLYNLAFASRLGTIVPRFIDLTFDYFAYYNNQRLSTDVIIKHFTDLLRTFHLQPFNRRPRRKDEQVTHLQSATELLEAGVKFKASESLCLLDMRFSKKVLEIPQVKVEDWTELLFRNLVALEQCHYPYESYVTDYVAVLDFLINTGRDVDVLVQNGIILNWLGDSNSVADLFNSLWKNITQANFSSHYLKLCNDLDAFYKDPWHHKKATLRRDYCNTPWQTAASVAGILILILSLIQSVCSVIQVVQQSS
ncbi:hypothetical protein L6164_024298 [Bauhinia variegata]|uniref:Uncharacterized protein n=1 Tax=Bauhinia variegata TaxID=167791 RepID=A0ACB9LZC8_BAUVA|nr:hypothetical protein L6164_024298 [Bauhinia variegata]